MNSDEVEIRSSDSYRLERVEMMLKKLLENHPGGFSEVHQDASDLQSGIKTLTDGMIEIIASLNRVQSTLEDILKERQGKSNE